MIIAPEAARMTKDDVREAERAWVTSDVLNTDLSTVVLASATNKGYRYGLAKHAAFHQAFQEWHRCDGGRFQVAKQWLYRAMELEWEALQE